MVENDLKKDVTELSTDAAGLLQEFTKLDFSTICFNVHETHWLIGGTFEHVKNAVCNCISRKCNTAGCVHNKKKYIGERGATDVLEDVRKNKIICTLYPGLRTSIHLYLAMLNILDRVQNTGYRLGSEDIQIQELLKSVGLDSLKDFFYPQSSTRRAEIAPIGFQDGDMELLRKIVTLALSATPEWQRNDSGKLKADMNSDFRALKNELTEWALKRFIPIQQQFIHVLEGMEP